LDSGRVGPRGVERVFEILRDETAMATRLLGVERVEELGPRHVNTRAVEKDIWDGPADLPGREGAMKGLLGQGKTMSGMIMSLSSVNN
jgi:L-lactate dehydrogenase (cytochrome)